MTSKIKIFDQKFAHFGGFQGSFFQIAKSESAFDMVIHFGVDHHLLEDVLIEEVERTPELKEVLAAVTKVRRAEKLRKKDIF